MGKVRKNKLEETLNKVIKLLITLNITANSLRIVVAFCKRSMFDYPKFYRNTVSESYLKREFIGKIYGNYIRYILTPINKISTHIVASLAALIVYKLIKSLLILKKKLKGIKIGENNTKSSIYRRWIRFIVVIVCVLAIDCLNIFVISEIDGFDKGLDSFAPQKLKYPSYVKCFCILDIFLYLFDLSYIYSILYYCPVKIRVSSK